MEVSLNLVAAKCYIEPIGPSKVDERKAINQIITNDIEFKVVGKLLPIKKTRKPRMHKKTNLLGYFLKTARWVCISAAMMFSATLLPTY